MAKAVSGEKKCVLEPSDLPAPINYFPGTPQVWYFSGNGRRTGLSDERRKEHRYLHGDTAAAVIIITPAAAAANGTATNSITTYVVALSCRRL